MEPHLPWVPECEQECYLLTPRHVPGPATELVSVEINCSINTHLFIYSTGGLSFVKTPDAPALLQDIYKGLLLYVLRRSLGSHSFRHLFFFFVFSMFAGDEILFSDEGVNCSSDIHLYDVFP